MLVIFVAVLCAFYRLDTFGGVNDFQVVTRGLDAFYDGILKHYAAYLEVGHRVLHIDQMRHGGVIGLGVCSVSLEAVDLHLVTHYGIKQVFLRRNADGERVDLMWGASA